MSLIKYNSLDLVIPCIFFHNNYNIKPFGGCNSINLFNNGNTIVTNNILNNTLIIWNYDNKKWKYLPINLIISENEDETFIAISSCKQQWTNLEIIVAITSSKFIIFFN